VKTKYRAYEVSFEESDEPGIERKIIGTSSISSPMRFKRLIDENPEKIYLEINGYSLDDTLYEGLLMDAPQKDYFDIEGDEEDWESVKRPRNPLEVDMLASFGPPKVHWDIRIEWSKQNKVWCVTKERKGK
jgi:hypothetical protein